MESEILDDDFENKEKTNQAGIATWISTIILWLGIAYCAVNGINDLLGEPKIIAAIILLAVSTAITYFNYKVGVKVTLGLILIGILNFITFFPYEISISFEISFLKIGFDLVLFTVGIIHYFTNKKELSRLFKDLFNRDLPAKEVQSAQRTRINAFKRRFSNRTIPELEVTTNNDKLVPEAIKAAMELIEERRD